VNEQPTKTLEERVAELEKVVRAPAPVAEEPDPLEAGYARFRARLDGEEEKTR
jgi:hypothetical protein